MSKTTAFILLGLFVVAAVAIPQPAFAAEDKSFLDSVLKDGGYIGMFIMLLSVAMFAMVIESLVNVRADKICPPELVDEIEALLEEDEFQEALELCENEPNFLTRSLAAGLPRLNEGHAKVSEAMEAQVGVEAVKLQQKISCLLFLSNIGTLLGLFGTVTGMIQAFNVIVAAGDKVTPQLLAGGISAALVTTFLGLVVAIPALTAYQYFRNKGIRIALHFSQVLEEMTDRFRAR